MAFGAISTEWHGVEDIDHQCNLSQGHENKTQGCLPTKDSSVSRNSFSIACGSLLLCNIYIYTYIYMFRGQCRFLDLNFVSFCCRRIYALKKYLFTGINYMGCRFMQQKNIEKYSHISCQVSSSQLIQVLFVSALSGWLWTLQSCINLKSSDPVISHILRLQG